MQLAALPPAVVSSLQEAELTLSAAALMFESNDEAGFRYMSDASHQIERTLGDVEAAGPATLLGRTLDVIEGAGKLADYSEPDSYAPEAELLNGPDVAEQAREAARLIGVLVPIGGEETR